MSNPAGWLGVFLDGLTNAGGIFGFAGRLLSFGPVSLTMGLAELNAADASVQLLSVAVISLLFGFGLSLAPHLLRRSARRGKE
jgi:hypothetical protein